MNPEKREFIIASSPVRYTLILKFAHIRLLEILCGLQSPYKNERPCNAHVMYNLECTNRVLIHIICIKKNPNLVKQHLLFHKIFIGQCTGCPQQKCTPAFQEKSKCLLKLTSFTQCNAQSLLYHLTKFQNYGHTQTTKPQAQVPMLVWLKIDMFKLILRSSA